MRAPSTKKRSVVSARRQDFTPPSLHANETGFCCNAAALMAILLHNARPHWLQQPVLAGRHIPSERPSVRARCHRSPGVPCSAPAVYAPGIAAPCPRRGRPGVGVSADALPDSPASTAPDRAAEPHAADRHLPRTERRAGACAPIVGPHSCQQRVCSFVHAQGLLTKMRSAALRLHDPTPAHRPAAAVSAATRVRYRRGAV